MNYFDDGYKDGFNNIGDEAREDRIDEISVSDGWGAASDYEDGYQDGQEDRDYDSYDSYNDGGYGDSCDSWGGYDGDY